MKENEVVRCPHCGSETPARLRTDRDGWTVVGRSFVCVFCGGKLGEPGAGEGGKSAAAEKSTSDRLRGLLGDIEEAPEIRLEPGSEYRRFCRHCRHFLEHPFLCRCARSGEEADPGGCCDDFAPKE